MCDPQYATDQVITPKIYAESDCTKVSMTVVIESPEVLLVSPRPYRAALPPRGMASPVNLICLGKLRYGTLLALGVRLVVLRQHRTADIGHCTGDCTIDTFPMLLGH
jgi:hypothetical protein